MESKRVGFIGMGIMGRPMSLNLLRAGFDVTVYNRTPGKTQEVVAAGAKEAASPKELAEASDYIITCVTGPEDVKEVVLGPGGVIEGAKPGSVVIDMSTISPEATRAIAAALAEKQVHMLDAPVSGGDIGAIRGTLTIMVGGEKEIVERCMPLFEAMGKTITHIGPVGSGQVTKLVNQVLIAVNLLAASEALTFAAKCGVDPEKVLAAVTAGSAGSWQLANLGPKMLARDFEPGFMIRLLQKDLRLALAEADRVQMPLLGTAVAHQLLRTAEGDGYGEEGTQAMVKVIEKLAGIQLGRG